MSNINFVDIEKSELSSNINSFILYVFWMGVYTVIYLGTTYIYLTRSSIKRRITTAVMSILFLCNVGVLGVNWYVATWEFVDNGGGLLEFFMGSIQIEHTNWVYIVLDTFTYTIFVLMDGLLIWRCFFAWNRSFRIISVPLFLIFTEIALFLVIIVTRALYGDNAALTVENYDLASVANFTSLGTSLVTTLLIACKIYSASKQGASQRRFKHVINIVVESGAVYSLSLLVFAITAALPGSYDLLNSRDIALDYYMPVLVNIIAAMSATALVARVSMLPTNTTFPFPSTHLSSLRFGENTTCHTSTAEGMEAPHPPGVDSSSVSDGLHVEDKVQ